MSIREEARQEAERRWPDVEPWRMGVNADREWRRRAFIDGVSWAFEQAARIAEEFDPVEAALAGRYAGKDIAARIREQGKEQV